MSTNLTKRLFTIRKDKWKWVDGMRTVSGYRVYVCNVREGTLNCIKGSDRCKIFSSDVPDLEDPGTLAYLEHQIAEVMDEPGWCPFLCAEGWALPFTDPAEHGAYTTRGEAVLAQLEVL